MAKFIASFLTFINLVLSLFGLPQHPTTEIDMGKFEETPVFVDEFDGDSFDKAKWREHYTEAGIRRGGYWDTDMITVADGKLTIKTAYMKDGLNGKPAGWYSAALDTKGLFENNYGYYECRFILPKGYGHWSAFWINGENVGNVDGSGKDGAEIDIMESPFWGNRILQNSTMHSIHYDGYGDAHKSKGSANYKISGDPYKEFHTYGLEWNKDSYTFYIDGKKTAVTDFGGVCEAKEFMILSVEVAGQNGIPSKDFAVRTIEDNKGGKDFQSEFIVDYVKVYEYKK